MLDSATLAHKIKEFGVTPEAVEECKTETFQYAIGVITRSVASGEMFFAEDAPKTFVQVIRSSAPLLESTDEY